MIEIYGITKGENEGVTSGHRLRCLCFSQLNGSLEGYGTSVADLSIVHIGFVPVRVSVQCPSPRDPSTFSEGTWTLQTYITVSPITFNSEKVRHGTAGSLG